MEVDSEGNIVQFHEKPKNRDKGNLASLGIYVFSQRVLEKRLSEGTEASPRLDFGHHVIPAMLAAGDNIVAYRYEGYWVDVGTIDAFWSTNLALLSGQSALDLYNPKWPVHTQSEERPAVKLGPQAKVVSSMLSNGCVIRGLVVNSVLSPGVYVSPGAVVKDSVIMNDTLIGPGARLDRVVVDKQARIGAGATVGQGDLAVANQQAPHILSDGITLIGRNTYVPEGARIGRNALINSGRDEADFPEGGVVPDGGTV
jgi:glucose-1-phosphate adenylyltransferase